MKPLFLFRLILDAVAAGILLAAFAYNGLGNLAHEIIGTVMFALLISHNIFNRRWYRTIANGRWEARSILSKAITLSLLISMLSLLVTSLIISQAVFSFLPLTSTFTARQIHTLVAYVALLIAALHLGLHWSLLMNVVRAGLGIRTRNRLRTIVLRVLALVIAVYGVECLIALNIGSKLLMQVSMGFGDFQMPTSELLVRHLSVIGLCVAAGHYGLEMVSRQRRLLR